MKTILRQCIGIDVSKDTLDVAICAILQENYEVVNVTSAIYENNIKSIRSLISWIRKNVIKNEPYQVLVEATGVYHEELTYRLYSENINVGVIMPVKVRNFVKSTNTRTVTDKISARMIAEYGLHVKVDKWIKPDVNLRQLKSLSRERVHLLEDKTSILNRKHAHQISVVSSKEKMRRFEKHIQLINQQIKEIEYEMDKIVNSDIDLNQRIKRICSVNGLGFITVASIIAETDGFKLFTNQRQLVCYAGYDVIIHESGTSVRSKPRISHKGNRYIRRALYYPALTAVRNEGGYFADLYNRLYDRQKIKMKAYTAVQRKLLILIYTLWKNNEVFNTNWQNSVDVLTGEAEAGSGGNQPARNIQSDWNGQRGE